jgi:hypothetical protein
MRLNEVKSQNQFDKYYQANNLQTVDQKVDYLKKEMKVRAMLSDEDETPEEILSGLEESALLGYWQASW